jgi:flagellar motor switch protein FliN/FliY
MIEEDKNNIGEIFDKIKGLMVDYDGVLDMSVVFKADLGETKITLKDFLKLEKGSVINLDKAAGESAEIFVNNKVVGKGEIMVYEKSLAVRINEILSSDAILYYFSRDEL